MSVDIHCKSHSTSNIIIAEEEQSIEKEMEIEVYVKSYRVFCRFFLDFLSVAQ